MKNIIERMEISSPNHLKAIIIELWVGGVSIRNLVKIFGKRTSVINSIINEYTGPKSTDSLRVVTIPSRIGDAEKQEMAVQAQEHGRRNQLTRALYILSFSSKPCIGVSKIDRAIVKGVRYKVGQSQFI